MGSTAAIDEKIKSTFSLVNWIVCNAIFVAKRMAGKNGLKVSSVASNDNEDNNNNNSDDGYGNDDAGWAEYRSIMERTFT